MSGFEKALTDFFWATALPFWAGFIILAIVLPIFWVIFWYKLMPPAAKTVFWARRRGKPLLLLAHDSGRGILTTITERRAEGIVITDEGKYKILPRYSPASPEIVPFPQSPELEKLQKAKAEEKNNPALENVDPEKVKSIKESWLDKQFVKSFEDWNVKRTNLIGFGLPFFVGYSGKICLLSPDALALYEAGEMAIETEEGKLFNPHEFENKKIEDALKPLLLLDPRKIGKIIYQGFDQSQIAAVIADTEELVRLGKGFSKAKAAGIAVIIIIIAILAILALPMIFPR